MARLVTNDPGVQYTYRTICVQTPIPSGWTSCDVIPFGKDRNKQTHNMLTTFPYSKLLVLLGGSCTFSMIVYVIVLHVFEIV